MAKLCTLEPAINNTGFVGSLSLDENRTKYFAVLLAERTDAARRADIVGAAHAQLRALRPEPDVHQLVSGASGLVAAFNQPTDILLRSHNQIEHALRKGIEAHGDSFTIACDTRDVYAELCTAIGITRADHLANAELYALINNEAPRRNKVIGSAHRLHDRLKNIIAVEENFANGKEVYRAPIVNFLWGLPIARKFFIGKQNLDEYAVDSRHVDYSGLPPESFRLPYPQCYFEAVIGSDIGECKVFYLAWQVDDDKYASEVLLNDPKNKIQIHNFGLSWDVSGERIEVGSVHRDDIVHKKDNASAYITHLMLALARINSPATSLILHNAPKELPPTIRKVRPTPYYDCHEVVVAPGTTRRLGEALSSGRVVRAHERRGHLRHYAHERYVNMRGKTIWVDPMHVGDPANGVLSKGYLSPSF